MSDAIIQKIQKVLSKIKSREEVQSWLRDIQSKPCILREDHINDKRRIARSVVTMLKRQLNIK
jgi:hypothetical protein